MPRGRPGVGNPGNRGGGRKSAYKEYADARALIDIWEGRKTQEELKKIIKSGKYGAKHVFAAKCMSGDIKALSKIVDKLYANKHDIVQKNIEVKEVDPVDLEKLENL